MPESINESHSIEEWIGGSRIGLELINEFGETLNIIGDSRGLFNLEELAYEGLMLVTIKTIMERLTEGGTTLTGVLSMDSYQQAVLPSRYMEATLTHRDGSTTFMLKYFSQLERQRRGLSPLNLLKGSLGRRPAG